MGLFFTEPQALVYFIPCGNVKTVLESILVFVIVYTTKFMICLAIYGMYDKVVIRNPQFWAVVEATKERYAHVCFTVDVSLRNFWSQYNELEDKLTGKRNNKIDYFKF